MGRKQPSAGVQADSRCVAQGEGKIAGVAAQFDLDLPAHRQIEAVRGVRGAVAEQATRGIHRAGKSPIREHARDGRAVLGRKRSQTHTHPQRDGTSGKTVPRLIWSKVQINRSTSIALLDVEYGVWFIIHTAYSYLVMIFGILLVVLAFIRCAAPGGQAAVLVLSGIAPLSGNAVYLLKLNPFPHLDMTPFAFTVAGLLWAWGLFHFQLLDIVPVARDAVIESMTDAVLVLDGHGRIVDINPAAQHILPTKRRRSDWSARRPSARRTRRPGRALPRHHRGAGRNYQYLRPQSLLRSAHLAAV